MYDAFFSVVDYVKKFSLGGGEPQLRPDLPKLLENLMAYQDQFEVMEIFTNGTIMPSEELLRSMETHKDKVFMMIDNYGTLSPLADQIAEVLQQRGIPHGVRIYYGENCHCGGWVDLGDSELKHPTEEECIATYRKCARYLHYSPEDSGDYVSPNGVSISLIDGLLTICAESYYKMRQGIISRNMSGGFVDLLDPSKSVQQKREDIIKFLQSESFPACAYCNGICEDSVRYMPAEQLPRKNQ